ncbi:apoptosis regulatory protein Siva isoform X2 [Brienomyrus brachyistius]|uniref:apoptosis regulatory protein Siva isoform X2 n=1 Tax=Brienomyrus brachyistius TaxID=42636 RepID=UPI0020B404F6|nr:apoptosis regulatory protein Siva isoform X2 [Brienomyrus brachyistius]
MPKRACPFAETFSSQYKIHIGQKELNHHGVFGSKYRQEVYDKTKTLLFNGTKAVMGRIWNLETEGKGSEVEMAGPGEAPAGSHGLLRGQTLIGQDGRLKRGTAAAGAPEASAVCCVCLKMPASRKPCAQCERHACPSCTRLCSGCSGVCCSVCTVVDYSERYDRVLCFDCSA